MADKYTAIKSPILEIDCSESGSYSEYSQLICQLLMNLEELDTLYLGGEKMILGHQGFTSFKVKLSHCCSNGDEAIVGSSATAL